MDRRDILKLGAGFSAALMSFRHALLPDAAASEIAWRPDRAAFRRKHTLYGRNGD